MPNTLEDMLDNIGPELIPDAPIDGSSAVHPIGLFSHLYSKASGMFDKVIKKAGNAISIGTISLATVLAACVTDGTAIQHGSVPFNSRLNIISDYGVQESWRSKIHSGIDFAAPPGTEVISASYGTVHTAIGGCAGMQVAVEHPLTYKETINLKAGGTMEIKWPVFFIYAHLDKVFVKHKQFLKPGDPIGTIIRAQGTRYSDKCGGSIDHVHYAINSSPLLIGTRQNPHDFWYNKEGTGNSREVRCYDPKVNYSGKIIGAVAPLKCR